MSYPFLRFPTMNNITRLTTPASPPTSELDRALHNLAEAGLEFTVLSPESERDGKGGAAAA